MTYNVFGGTLNLALSIYLSTLSVFHTFCSHISVPLFCMLCLELPHHRQFAKSRNGNVKDTA